VYKRFINSGSNERKTLLISRALVVLLGVFALLQGAYFESILKAALYAYTVYGAAITPVVMAVFFWKRATTSGAVTSIVLGTVITVVWNVLGYEDAVYPALGMSILSLVVVSLLSPPPAKEKWAPFFEKAESIRANP
jgi:Na+/proline symporter